MAETNHADAGLDFTFAGLDRHDDKSDKGYHKEVNMTKLKLSNTYLPLVFIFVAVNALCVIFNNKLDEWKIDHLVLQGANLLLFLLMFASAYLHFKALYKPNPHAFMRSVMGATALKLFVIAGAAFIYLLVAGENRSVYAVLAGMLLYVIYTIVEMRGIVKLNKQAHNGAA